MGRRNRVAKSTQKVLNRNPEKEWKTALYARLSSENNGLEDSRSLGNQVRYIQDYIEKHPNMKLCGEYVDNGYSGTNYDRPQFLRLMEDIKSGNIDCVVVKDLSRFGRNYLEAGYYLEKIFPFLDVRFIAINDNYDNMDESKKDSLIVPIKNMVNEMYARDISRKMTATLRTKENKCEIWYGHAPYGYVKNPDQPFKLDVDPDAGAVVKLMFKWAAEGIGLCEITRKLEKAKIPTPWEHLNDTGVAKSGIDRYTKRPKRWSVSSLQRILKNPVYMGDTVYNKGFQSVISKTDRVEKPRNEWRVIPDTHEALADRETFKKAFENLEERRKKQVQRHDGRAELREETPDIFAGMFFCADCGCRMLYYRDIKGDTVRHADYYCSGFNYGAGGWNSENGKERLTKDVPICRVEKTEIPERLLKMLLFDQICWQISAGMKVEEMLKEMAKSDTEERRKAEAEIRQLELNIDNWAQKQHRLYEDYAEGIIDSRDYREIKEGYSLKAADAKEELKQKQDTLASMSGKNPLLSEWEQMKKRLCELNGEDNLADIYPERLTKELVTEMIKRIEYGSKQELHITFRHRDWAAELERLTECEESTQKRNLQEMRLNE